MRPEPHEAREAQLAATRADLVRIEARIADARRRYFSPRATAEDRSQYLDALAERQRIETALADARIDSHAAGDWVTRPDVYRHD